jgi:hypothetical protein
MNDLTLYLKDFLKEAFFAKSEFDNWSDFLIDTISKQSSEIGTYLDFLDDCIENSNDQNMIAKAKELLDTNGRKPILLSDLFKRRE